MQQAPKILPLLHLEGGARSVADLCKKCNKILNSPTKFVADFNKKCNKHSENREKSPPSSPYARIVDL